MKHTDIIMVEVVDTKKGKNRENKINQINKYKIETAQMLVHHGMMNVKRMNIVQKPSTWRMDKNKIV